MPDVTITPAGKVQITPEQLATSAAKIRPELLKMPVLALGKTLNYFSLRTGIRHSEMVGEMDGDFELAPYDPYRVDREDVSVNGRRLYTFLGSIVKEFDPNSVYQSIYGSSIVRGDGLKNVPIVQQVLALMAGKLGQSLARSLFKAVRKDGGNKTVDLFNGVDTVTATEIEAGNISVEKGNLYEFPEVIDSTNAVEVITDFCRSANEMLLDCQDGEDSKGDGLILYVPRSVLYAYRDDYKATTGHSPIYDKFNQVVVEGFENIRMVPFAGKQNSPYIHLSTRKNMLIGVDQTPGSVENITVEKHHAFLLQFIATLFFGFEFESISPERLFVGKLKTKESAPATPQEPETPKQGEEDEDAE